MPQTTKTPRHLNDVFKNCTATTGMCFVQITVGVYRGVCTQLLTVKLICFQKCVCQQVQPKAHLLVRGWQDVSCITIKYPPPISGSSSPLQHSLTPVNSAPNPPQTGIFPDNSAHNPPLKSISPWWQTMMASETSFAASSSSLISASSLNESQRFCQKSETTHKWQT